MRKRRLRVFQLHQRKNEVVIKELVVFIDCNGILADLYDLGVALKRSKHVHGVVHGVEIGVVIIGVERDHPRFVGGHGKKIALIKVDGFKIRLNALFVAELDGGAFFAKELKAIHIHFKIHIRIPRVRIAVVHKHVAPVFIAELVEHRANAKDQRL